MGSILLKTAYILILLSTNLVGIIGHVTYDSPQFIALLVIWAYLLCGFLVWESYGARNRLLDCASLRDCTIVGVFMLKFIQHFCFTFIGFLFKCLTLLSTVSPCCRDIVECAARCCRILHS